MEQRVGKERESTRMREPQEMGHHHQKKSGQREGRTSEQRGGQGLGGEKGW